MNPPGSDEREHELIDAARRQVHRESIADPNARTQTASSAGMTASTREAHFGELGEIPELPDQLGSVRLVRKIGRGGMGLVFLGQDELLNRNVAVKFLLDAAPDKDDHGFARFLEGAQAAAAVQYSGLTTIYHADVFRGVPYLLMEYVDGPTLAQVLQEDRLLRVAATLKIIQAVATAVAELHRHGVIHRDIKPSNVLLDRAGRILVTDFGISCRRSLLEMTAREQEVAGTPAYMAPEMFEGTISPRTDVYALGIMTFTLLTGTPPFSGTLDELHQEHRKPPLPVERLLRQNISGELTDVLERTTHKQAFYRYKTAREFLQALQGTREARLIESVRSAEIATLASRCGARPCAERSASEPVLPSSSFYEQLSQAAASKRRNRQPATPERSHVPIDFDEEDEPDRAFSALAKCFPELLRFDRSDRAKVVDQLLINKPGGEQYATLACFVGAVLVAYLMARFRPVWDLLNPFGAWGTVLAFVAAFAVTLPAAAALGRLLYGIRLRTRLRRELRKQLSDRGVLICLKCGYDLRGATSPRCSECGYCIPLIQFAVKLRGRDESGPYLITCRVNWPSQAHAGWLAYTEAREAGLKISDIIDVTQVPDVRWWSPEWKLGAFSLSEKTYLEENARSGNENKNG